jgi:hypothetical protein
VRRVAAGGSGIARARRASASFSSTAPTRRGRWFRHCSCAAFSLRVDWGDGSPVERFTFPPGGTVSLGASPTVSVTHRYHRAGTFTIHLSWGDDRGTANGADLVVTVLAT